MGGRWLKGRTDRGPVPGWVRTLRGLCLFVYLSNRRAGGSCATCWHERAPSPPQPHHHHHHHYRPLSPLYAQSLLGRHDRPGILSMANSGRHTNNSQFFLTFKPCPWLDGKHVVCGQVVAGFAVLKRLEQAGSKDGEPKAHVGAFFQHPEGRAGKRDFPRGL